MWPSAVGERRNILTFDRSQTAAHHPSQTSWRAARRARASATCPRSQLAQRARIQGNSALRGDVEKAINISDRHVETVAPREPPSTRGISATRSGIKACDSV